MRTKSIYIQCLTHWGLLLFFHSNCSRKKAGSHHVICDLRLVLLMLYRPINPFSFPKSQLFILIYLLQARFKNSWSCITTIIIYFSSASRFINFSIWHICLKSSPLVGSSKISSFFPLITAWHPPCEVLFHWSFFLDSRFLLPLLLPLFHPMYWLQRFKTYNTRKLIPSQWISFL